MWDRETRHYYVTELLFLHHVLFFQLCEYLFEYISTQIPPPPPYSKERQVRVTEFLYFCFYIMFFKMLISWQPYRRAWTDADVELRGLGAASLEPGLQQLAGRPPHPHHTRPRRGSDGQLLVRRAEQPRRLQVMQLRQTDRQTDRHRKRDDRKNAKKRESEIVKKLEDQPWIWDIVDSGIGCRTGLPAFLAGGAGTTTQGQSHFYPPSQGLWIWLLVFLLPPPGPINWW